MTPPVPEAPPAPAPEPIPVLPDDPTSRILEAIRAPAPPQPTVQEDPEVRLRLDAVELLEKTGRAPVGTSLQYREYVAAEAAYKAKWEAEHPDEEFNLSEREHAKFVNSKYPRALRPEIVDRAETEVLIERKAEEKVAGLRRQFEEQQLAQAAQARAASLGQVLENAAGNDPLVKHFVKEAAPLVSAMAQEATLLFSGARTPNPSNPQHQSLLALVGQAESQISATGAKDEYGRRVVSSAEFARIPAHQRTAFVPLNQAPDVVASLVATQALQQAQARANAVRPLVAPPAPVPAPAPRPAPTPAPVTPAPTTPAAPPVPSHIKRFKFA